MNSLRTSKTIHLIEYYIMIALAYALQNLLKQTGDFGYQKGLLIANFAI